MRVWIDIDNPPQVQYLAPFVDAFQRRGHGVCITARDYGITTELLRARGVPFTVVGRELGASRGAKWRGTVARALRLAAIVARRGRPALLLATSRSGAMAAWLLRVPSFMVLDYEHAETRSFCLLGTTVLHPDAIGAATLEAKGFRPQKLVAFAGIKEDISFAGRDLGAIRAHDFGVPRDGKEFVLVRPPSETSHYFDAASRSLTESALSRLAARPDVRVVFSPRHPHQVEALEAHAWRNEPIVLAGPVEFVSLLKAVDRVVCAGGTMLREAAYLGVPAISLLGSEVGAVDRFLEASGAIDIVGDADDLDGALRRPKARVARFAHHPELVESLTDRMVPTA